MLIRCFTTETRLGELPLCPSCYANLIEPGLLRSILFDGRGETILEEFKRIRREENKMMRDGGRGGGCSIDAPVEDVGKVGFERGD